MKMDDNELDDTRNMDVGNKKTDRFLYEERRKKNTEWEWQGGHFQERR